MPAIGQMDVVLSADTTALLGGLNRLESRMTRSAAVAERHAGLVSASFGKIGRAITAAQTVFVGWIAAVGSSRLIRWFNQASEEVDKLGKAAKRLGLSSEELSALKFAAGESGVEFEKLSTMAGKAARVVAELVERGQSTQRLGAIAIRLTDVNGEVRNLSELLPDIARGIESAGSEAEQLRLAEKFFGRGGGDQFVTWLKESGQFVKGLADQTERARRLGVLFTEDQVAKLTAYNDALGRIDQALLGLRVNILTRIAPALEAMANKTASFISAVPEMVERLVRAVQESMSDAGGPLGDQLDTVIGSLGEVAKKGVELAARVAFGVLLDMSDLAWAAIGRDFQRKFVDNVIGPLQVGLRGVAYAIDLFSADFEMGATKAVEAAFGAARQVLEVEARLASQDIFAPLEEQGAEWQRQWLVGRIGVSQALRQLGEDADGLLDATGALARHAMTGFEQVGEAAKKTTAASTELQKRLADLAETGNREISGFARSASDALADFALDGKLELEDLARSWTKTLISMAAQALVFKPLFENLGAGFGGLFSGAGTAGAASSGLGGVEGPPATGFAHGGVVRSTRFAAANGMVLNQRTHFPQMRAVAAEAGHPEWAFAPLRKIGGDLGVKSAPPNVNVQVIDQRSGGARPQVSTHTGPDGAQVIRVMVRDEMKRALSDGSTDRVMGDAYGLRRRGTAR